MNNKEIISNILDELSDLHLNHKITYNFIKIYLEIGIYDNDIKKCKSTLKDLIKLKETTDNNYIIEKIEQIEKYLNCIITTLILMGNARKKEHINTAFFNYSGQQYYNWKLYLQSYKKYEENKVRSKNEFP